jgi:hypothetical protein
MAMEEAQGDSVSFPVLLCNYSLRPCSQHLAGTSNKAPPQISPTALEGAGCLLPF